MKSFHVILCCALFALPARSATTIDPAHAYAWAGNIGWTVWDHAVIGEYVCSGHVWMANCGWIDLGNGMPSNGIHYGNTSSSDYGVNLQTPAISGGMIKAKLRGFAYASNIGWLDFEATGNPEISLETGRLSGSVWSANCGWIVLDGTSWFLRSSTIQAGGDSDGDGIADAYELEHTYPANLTSLTATGDADGDGQSDVDEYRAGTNAVNARSSLQITGFSITGASCTLTWASSLSRIYRISSSVSMHSDSWDPLLDQIIPDGESTSRIVTADVVAKRFFRVEAYPPLPH